MIHLFDNKPFTPIAPTKVNGENTKNNTSKLQEIERLFQKKLIFITKNQKIISHNNYTLSNIQYERIVGM